MALHNSRDLQLSPDCGLSGASVKRSKDAWCGYQHVIWTPPALVIDKVRNHVFDQAKGMPYDVNEAKMIPKIMPMKSYLRLWRRLFQQTPMSPSPVLSELIFNAWLGRLNWTGLLTVYSWNDAPPRPHELPLSWQRELCLSSLVTAFWTSTSLRHAEAVTSETILQNNSTSMIETKHTETSSTRQ